MDYLKRAEEVRTFNNLQLKALVEVMTLAGVTPYQIVVLTMAQPTLQEMGLQLILLDNYIAGLREAPASTKAEAHANLLYAMSSTFHQTKTKIGDVGQLSYQLFNEDYQPPKAT
jgi:hypothetical protein